MSEYVKIIASLDDGCSLADDELSINVVRFSGNLCLDKFGGESEIELIETAATDYIISEFEDVAPLHVHLDLYKIKQIGEGSVNEYFEVAEINE